MRELLNSLVSQGNFLNIPHIGLKDILDLAVVMFIVSKTFSVIRDTRTWTLFRGVLLILVVGAVSNLLQLHTTWWIVSKTITVGILALIVVFQPELRRALEQLGKGGNLFSTITYLSGSKSDSLDVHSINEITRACVHMKEQCTGALIVIERTSNLNDIEVSGIPINATITFQLIVNIFERNTPLHDGSVIIRDNKILAATCILPLSSDLGISKDLGTRHRAAIGISERTDALVLVVSEETGSISCVENGEIIRDLDEFKLGKLLKNAFIEETSPKTSLNHFRKGAKHE